MIEARPFEEYKEMIQDMSKEKMIKGLYDLSKNVIEKENEIERLNKEIKTMLDIVDKEKVLVEQHFSSNGEHKEFYEVTFDYDFLISIFKGSEKE